MDNCFSGSKQGRIAQQEYEEKVKLLVELELKKHTMPVFDSEEMNKAYQEEIRRLLEDRVRRT